MKCCGCNKEIDITDKNPINGEAQWYGKYIIDKCIKAICKDCIKVKEKKQKYLK